MSRRTPLGALLLTLLLLPTPALCAICAAEGCAMERAVEDCPMEKAPAGCCDKESETDHGAAHPVPMDHQMPVGHDCAGPPTAAGAADCCTAAAGRDAEAPASAAPAPPGGPPAVHPGLSLAPDLAADASGARQAMPPPASSRALFTLHRALLI